jgi:phosphoribosylformylglycinamidine (FGAM) synthase-like enzyme
MGLAFDDWDLEYYTKLFTDMGRDPTNVELFDIAQSNSEHSRHWFFKGDLVIDGKPVGENLMDVVRAPLEVRGRGRGGGARGGGQGSVRASRSRCAEGEEGGNGLIFITPYLHARRM